MPRLLKESASQYPSSFSKSNSDSCLWREVDQLLANAFQSHTCSRTMQEYDGLWQSKVRFWHRMREETWEKTLPHSLLYDDFITLMDWIELVSCDSHHIEQFLGILETSEWKIRPRTNTTNIELVMRVDIDATVTALNIGNQSNTSGNLYFRHNIVILSVTTELDTNAPQIWIRTAIEYRITCYHT